MAEDSHCTTMSHIPAMMEKVVALAPAFGHGETEDNPKPAPRKTRTTDMALAAIPPPMMAAHEIAETEDSTGAPGSSYPVTGILASCMSAPDQGEKMAGGSVHPTTKEECRDPLWPPA